MKYIPPFGSLDPNASYVNGNPGIGVEGSIPPANSFEHPQRELLAIIAAGGLTPTDADLTQVLQALRKLFNPMAPTYWDLSSPGAAIASGVETQIGAFGTNNHREVDNSVNASTGAVTIGANDAGLYVISANYLTLGAGMAERVYIKINGAVRGAQGGVANADDDTLDQSLTRIMRLSAGDVVTTSYYQTNAGAASRSLSGWFGGARVGN